MEIKQLCFSYLCHDVQTLKKKKETINKQKVSMYIIGGHDRSGWYQVKSGDQIWVTFKE